MLNFVKCINLYDCVFLFELALINFSWCGYIHIYLNIHCEIQLANILFTIFVFVFLRDSDLLTREFNCCHSGRKRSRSSKKVISLSSWQHVYWLFGNCILLTWEWVGENVTFIELLPVPRGQHCYCTLHVISFNLENRCFFCSCSYWVRLSCAWLSLSRQNMLS